MTDEEYSKRLEEMSQKGLTGEGFSKEEADEIYRNRIVLPMPPEKRKEYLAWLRAASARMKQQ